MASRTESSPAGRNLQHETVVLERVFDAPVSRVFAAFAEPAARMRWAVPQGERIEYLQTDFAVGGRDVFRCGPPDAMDYQGDVRYELIQPDRCIVYTESMSTAGRPLSAALTSVEFVPQAGRTQVVVTAQVASIDGSRMADGYRQGWTAVLARLVEELHGKSAREHAA